MPAKPESRFIERVHTRLPIAKLFYREKMANPYRSGTPDVWYSGKNDLWVEYKYVALPARAGSYIHFDVSPLQKRWIDNRRLEGRDVWLIVGSSVGGLIFRDDFPDGMVKHLYMQRVQTVIAVAEALLSFCQPKIGGQRWEGKQGVPPT